MRRSFRLDRPETSDDVRQVRRVVGSLMLLAIPFLWIFGMAWLIAEGPGPDGRIRGAPQGAYSPWLFLLSIVFFFVGTRWASGRSLFGPPGRAEARWGFGCLALIASILLLAGFSLVAQAFGSGVLSEAFWVQAAKAIIPIAIGVGLFEIGSRMIRSAERAAGAIAAQPSQTLEDR